jgi:hypothetical protein
LEFAESEIGRLRAKLVVDDEEMPALIEDLSKGGFSPPKKVPNLSFSLNQFGSSGGDPSEEISIKDMGEHSRNVPNLR